jgi:quinol monooxygenase YgiN
MPEIGVVAVYHVDPTRMDEALSAFERVLVESDAEPGLLEARLAQDNDDPSVLVLVERWGSQEALDSHLTQPYVAEFARACEGVFVEAPSVLILTPVALGGRDDPGRRDEE